MLGHKRMPSREGGVEVVVTELATRMAALGHDVTVYNRQGHDVAGRGLSPVAPEEYEGVRIKTVPTVDVRGLAAASSSYFAARAAVADRPDVIHFHAEGPCAMIPLARRAHIRSVATIHGLDWQRAKWGRLASGYLRHGERLAAAQADELIVLSRNVQDYFRDTYGREAHYIPNGVTVKAPVPVHTIASKYGLSAASYVLFVGRIVPEKGVHYLIEAWRGVRTDKRLIIAGGPSDSQAYFNRVRALAGDDPSILFTGFVQGRELEELYSNAYLYVLPSDLEGMPMSLLEAMSYGNCCLTSDIAECAETLSSAGATFPRGDVVALRSSLTQLLENPAHVSSLGIQARMHVSFAYGWDAVVARTLALYRGGGELLAYMRVLLVNKFHYPKGGAETYYFALGERLEQMGHDVAYFSMRHPSNVPCAQDAYFVTQREYNEAQNPIKTLRDGWSLVYSREARNSFDALLRDFRPDVVHLNNVHRQITLSILDAPSLGTTPVLYTAHDYITVCPNYLMLDGAGEVCDACLGGRFGQCVARCCVKGSRAKSALAAVEAKYIQLHRLNERIDKVIAPSRFMRSKLVEGGWPDDKVVWMQNFASDAICDQARAQGADSTDHEHPYLLFFGRISKEKGVDVLVRAFQGVIDTLPDGWHMVIAGEGPERTAAEALSKSMPGASRVEFVGFQQGDALRANIEGASLAVTASRWRENMPYSVIEAFGAGTPVIGSRIGGIPELVIDGETGLLCEPGDVRSLADAIMRGVRLCSDIVGYHAMQQRCRDYVLDHCSQDAYMASLVHLYGGLIDAES